MDFLMCLAPSFVSGGTYADKIVLAGHRGHRISKTPHEAAYDTSDGDGG